MFFKEEKAKVVASVRVEEFIQFLTAPAVLPSNSTNANANGNTNTAVSPGLIAGVVISGVVFILILLGTRFLLMRRRNKNKSGSPPPPQSNDSYLNANNPLIYPTSRVMSGGPSSV